MTERPEALPDKLRRSMDELGGLVRTVAASLEDSSHDGTSLDLDAISSSLSSLDTLATQLNDSARLITALHQHRAYRVQYEESAWSERESRLRLEFERDRDMGTQEWLSAWTTAFGVGAWDEARRLVATPFPLADWACWIPDRCAILQDAVVNARYDARASAGRLVELVELLLISTSDSVVISGRSAADQKLVDRLRLLPAAAKVRLVVIVVRVLVMAGDNQAPSLLQAARRLLPDAAGDDAGSLLGAVSSAESFSARLAPAATDVGRFELSRELATSDLGCANEYLIRAREPQGQRSGGRPRGRSSGGALAEAESLVRALPSIAGAHNYLNTFLTPVQTELTVALAARMTDEAQYQQAHTLLEAIASTDPAIRVATAELKSRCLAGCGASADEVAGALTFAGDEALFTEEYHQAEVFYTRSLELRPRHPETLRSLADAILVQTPSDDANTTRDRCLRAIQLCAEARAIEPIEPATLWALGVEHSAHNTLAQLLIPDRWVHAWTAIRLAAESVLLQPTASGWPDLAVYLSDMGASYTGYAVAAAGCSADDDLNAVAVGAYAYAALEIGDVGEAARQAERMRSLSENSMPDFVEAVLGIANWTSGRLEDAKKHFRAAISEEPEIVYHRYLAEASLEAGDADAMEQWRWLWREADHSTWDGLEASASAAAVQGLVASTTELAGRMEQALTNHADESPPLLLRGLVAVLESDGERGWDVLSRAGESMLPDLVEPGFRLIRTIIARSSRQTEIVSRLDGLIADITARRRALFAGPDPGARARIELAAIGRQLHEPTIQQALAAVERALAALRSVAPSGVTDQGKADQDGDAAQPSDGGQSDVDPSEGDRWRVRLALPPSWFAGLEGHEEDHVLFRRAIPNARAAASYLRRVDPRYYVRVSAAAEREPDGILIELPTGPPVEARIDPDAWYCPPAWLRSLSPERAQAARSVDVPGGLVQVAAPRDSVDRLTSLSGIETVARVVFSVVESSRIDGAT